MTAKWIEEIWERRCKRMPTNLYEAENWARKDIYALLLEIDRLNGLVGEMREFPDKILPFLCYPDPGNGFGRACLKRAIEMTQAARSRLEGE